MRIVSPQERCWFIPRSRPIIFSELIPIFKQLQRYRRGQMSNYMLPFAQTLEVAASSTVSIFAGTNNTQKLITNTNLFQDFTSPSAGPRVATFRSFKVTALRDFQVTTNQSSVFMQIFAVTPEGYNVPLTRQKMLSTVNQTTLNARIPLWLITPVPVAGTTSTILMIQFTTPFTLAVGTGASAAFTVVAEVEMSPDEPNNF